MDDVTRGQAMKLLATARFALACMTALCLAVAPVNAGMMNGSFETPTVPAGGFSDFAIGSTAITGWTVVGPGVSIVSGTFSQSGITFQAQDGLQWLDLTGNSRNSTSDGVSQNVPTTVGQVYALSFYVGSTTGGGLFAPSTVDLSVNSGARVSFTNPTAPSNMLNWEQFTVTFTATTAMTNITFFNGDSSPNNNNASLDNVSLAAVPEPASLTLLGIGGAGMGIVGIARRRRRG